MEQNDPSNNKKPDQDDDTTTQGNSQSGRRTESRRLRRIILASPYPLNTNTPENQVPSVRQPRRVATTFLSNVPTPAANSDFNRMCGFSQAVETFDHLASSGLEGQNLVDTFFNRNAPDDNRGLTNERIGKFEGFEADESFKEEKCIVCHDDIEPGREMVRLDCHVSHIMCKICAKNWFKNHNTCPSCRKVFS